MDGTANAAFDMKSLGKHIEAVRPISWSLRVTKVGLMQVSPDPASHLSPREEMETSLIRSLIASYFAIVRQTIQDLVPKAIMHFLVNYTSEHVQNRLVASLYKPELFDEMLNEDDTIVRERERVKALLEAYKEAFKTLSEVNLKPM
jgi:dynamin 1-like protein